MTTKTPFLLAVATVAAASLALAAPAQTATTKSVKVGDNYFVTARGVPTVRVKHGTTVRWNFAGHSFHDVTVSSGPVKFHSKVMSSGSFSERLTKKGIYKIYCTIHGAKDQSMILKVT
ncbi:MAG TPA: hypothetical protein VGF63_14190 [Solirubrobacteraceae bacterium]|jgi:plastocyanin